MVSQLPKFPISLDNDFNLYHVFNTSESELIKPLSQDGDEIFISPRDFSELEKWNKNGGIINIEGELIFYSQTIIENNPNPPQSNNPAFSFFDDPSISDQDKNAQRRVISFFDLERGLGNNSARSHSPGEWARGYVMAEHHNALKQAMIGVENLIGVDNSNDHMSIDFRLRDLEELIIERDDLDCPFGTFWYEIIDQNQHQKTVIFHISIFGEFDTFEFLPEEGVDPITDNLNPKWTYRADVNISALLTIFRDRCCICVGSIGAVCEPCEFTAPIPDIPELICPEIDILEIPNIPIDITCFCPEVKCSITECPELPIISIENPTTPTLAITIPDIPTEITLQLSTDINVENPTIDVNVNVDVTFANPDQESGGACFKLVPCSGGVLS